jgi:hypothetical protein
MEGFKFGKVHENPCAELNGVDGECLRIQALKCDDLSLGGLAELLAAETEL